MWGPKVAWVIPEVAGEIPGWPCTGPWSPMVPVLDEWEPPRQYRELTDTSKSVAEILAYIAVHYSGKKEGRQ